MLSLTKITTMALLASALLCTSAVAAAHKAKGGSKSKVRTATATAPHSKASHHASSRKQSKTATVSAHKGSRGKVQTVVATETKPKFRGQQAIDGNRTMEIQQALIREHYLSGEASGQWDQATRDALTRFQGDNHWQTKILPDARALIKLGLGPSHQNLLNPESAAIAVPYQGGVGKSAPGGSN